MKLLIITQKVDIKDSILGFFHEWIERMAQKAEMVYVICLYEGEHHLPDNVEVFSLGKEKGKSRVKYIFNLYRYFFNLAGKIDIIFVHMNTIYVVLLGPLAKLFGIPLAHWKVHKGEIPFFNTAIMLADKIITVSKESLEYETSKKVTVGHGVDTDFFVPPSERPSKEKKEIITIGRISPSKNQKALIEVADILVNQKGVRDIKFKIVGPAFTEKQKEYLASLQEIVKDKNLEEFVDFVGPVTHEETLNYYQGADLFVSFCNTTGLDKVLLEAMSCGTVIFTSQDTLVPFLGDYREKLIVEDEDYNQAADRIQELINLSPEERKKIGLYLREVVKKYHALDRLIEKLFNEFGELIHAR